MQSNTQHRGCRWVYRGASHEQGASGLNGSSGNDGIDGTSGFPGSFDPNNPSPGGDGSNGSNGSDGQNGGDGSDGPTVEVQVTLRSGSHPLLQLGVTAAGHKERFYLVDPQGGSLTMTSSGGAGGFGGKGGRGGSGGLGTPNGSNGRDGTSGQDGRDGSQGRTGSITVIYDPKAQPFLAAIHSSNPRGLTPTFREQPVAPLW